MVTKPRRRQASRPTRGPVKRLQQQVAKLKREIESIREQEGRLELILQHVADGITVQDATGRVVYVNDAGARACGFPSAKTMMKAVSRPAVFAESMRRFEIRDEQGNLLPWEKLPGRRALRGEKNPQALINYFDKKTGKARWSLVKSRAVYSPEGVAQLVVNIWSDITEREEFEKRKDHFIGMASHELKTPITTLKVFTHVLKKHFESAEDAPQYQHLVRMDEQLNRLIKLIGSLLDISRIQTGKLQYDDTFFDVVTVVKKTVQDIQSSTSTHRIVVRGAESISVWGDAERIGQVVINLITNAIKYSPEADKIIVTVAKVPAGVRVSIQDFGLGVPQRHQEKIFQRFYRVYDGTQKTFPGLGIGLYLSSEIIKHYHGKIGVTSRPKVGSTFYFVLPHATTPAKAAREYRPA